VKKVEFDPSIRDFDTLGYSPERAARLRAMGNKERG
jgi:hypothetical protein